MERYLCIHGHFYQPPRENPWLESVEIQDSAWPFHDWNERIQSECYRPNGAARILGGTGRIHRVFNNYARMSFNFGPTLLSWMEVAAPRDYARILRADRRSQERFGGHGSALAQAYNHLIMPLATARDRRTQVVWGARDFEHRFRRTPEGMWLPETAVDIPTLEALAEAGIAFTILEPQQAARFRALDGGEWQEVGRGGIDPTRAYLQRLPSGRSITLFFYDGPVSRAVAFEKLLEDGVRFVERLDGLFRKDTGRPQLVHIATDGETYGHHHRHGEMALAFTLRHYQASESVRLTNYGEYLELHPPTHEVEIRENTSWSCAHGIERWRSDCGCSTGGQSGWTQAWRAPLRDALDWLRDSVAVRFEETAGRLLRDPWAARDDYIDVILDRRSETLDRFFETHAAKTLSGPERAKVACLMEMQRHAMLMYTSCGWFFADPGGLETVQVLRYADRVLQLAETVLGPTLEPAFLARLQSAKSNHPARGSCARIFDGEVRPSRVSLAKVAAHWAVSSLFHDYQRKESIYCYRADRERGVTEEAGEARLALGRVNITSTITLNSRRLAYGVVHFGDHNLTAGVAPIDDDEAFEAMERELLSAFHTADLPELVRRIDRHFGTTSHSLASLFRDEQRRILDRVLEHPLDETEDACRRLYRHHAVLLRFLHGLEVPLPLPLKVASSWVFDLDLRRALEREVVDTDELRAHLRSAADLGLELANPGLTFALGRALARIAERLEDRRTDTEALERLRSLAELARELSATVDLWMPQNLFWLLRKETLEEMSTAAEGGDAAARRWLEVFGELGDVLNMETAVLPPPNGGPR